MKAMLTGFAATIIIAIGAWFALQNAGFSSADVSSSPAVRLD